jgi:hypothetical protein
LIEEIAGAYPDVQMGTTGVLIVEIEKAAF